MNHRLLSAGRGCLLGCALLLVGCPNRIDVAKAGEHAGMITLGMVPVGRAFDPGDMDVEDYEIYVGNPDGSQLRRLTWNEVADVQPVWSRDSSKIAYVTETARQDEEGDEYFASTLAVYDFKWDGSFALESDAYRFDTVAYPAFGPDDTVVASTEGGDLVSVRFDEGAFSDDGIIYPSDPSHVPAYFPVWSPNGKWIAFNGDFKTIGAMRPDGTEVALVDMEALAREVPGVEELTTYWPIWRSRNRIWFTAYAEGVPLGTTYVFSFDVRTGQTTIVDSLERIAFGYASLSTDGRRLVGIRWRDAKQEEMELMAYDLRDRKVHRLMRNRTWTDVDMPLPVWTAAGREVMVWDAGAFVRVSPWGSVLSSFDLGKLAYRTNFIE